MQTKRKTRPSTLACLAGVLLGTLIAPACAAAGAAPVWAVPRLTAAPKIDGVVAAPEWAGAAAITGFHPVGKRQLVRNQPVVYLGYDNGGLYAAAVLPRTPGADLVCKASERDGRVWADDSIELFLTAVDGPYRHFILNARNARYDEKGEHGAAWNGAWRSATRIRPGAWSAEIAVPWTDLGRESSPSLPVSLRGNVCWNRPTGAPTACTWAPVVSDYHEPEHFAVLRLVADGPAVRFTQLQFARNGLPLPTFAMSGGAKPMPFVLEVLAPDKTVAFSATRRIGVTPVRVFQEQDLRALTPGSYSMTYRCGKLARNSLDFEVPQPFDWTVTQRMLAGEVDMAFNLGRLSPDPEPKSVRVRVFPEGKKHVVRELVLPVKGQRALGTFSVKEMPVGRYSMQAEVLDAGGGVVAERAGMAFRKPSAPKWLHYDGGLSYKVLPPWTPVKVDAEQQVRVWGREYGMRNGLFPESVVARGEDILARPVTLRARIDGKSVEWRPQPAKVVTHRDDRVSMVGEWNASGLRMSGTSVVEYDGMLRVDLVVAPVGASRKTDLVLEVPLKSRRSRYLYFFPGVWGSTVNSGALPADGWHSGFKPYVWLGDDDAGLAWFCESAQNWRPQDPEHALTIDRSGGETVLRLHLLEDAVLTAPRHYTFGFQASPVKPVTKDAWDYRILRIGSYGLEKPRANRWNQKKISWPGRGNINPEKGCMEVWVRPDFEPGSILRNKDGRSQNMTIFYVYVDAPGGPRQSVDLSWSAEKRGFALYATVGSRDIRARLFSPSCSQWKKGEWHRLGLTWGKNSEVALWIDGRRAIHWKNDGLFPLPVSWDDATLDHLHVWLVTSRFAVDELRISKVVRDLTAAPTLPFTADAGTLLLEHFDNGLPAAPGVMVAGVCHRTPAQFGNGVTLYDPEERSLIEQWAALGVRTIVFHQSWSDIQNSGIPADPAGLRRLVKACHENGMQLLLYFGFQISDAHPDWDVYHTECLQTCSDPHAIPTRPLVYNRRKPPQHAYQVCYHSEWRDYLAWSVANLMDEYDIDGVYLDGTEYPFPCSNPYHGCGYIGEDGKRHDTFRIFAVRDLMRRLRTIVKSRKPDGQINAHNSTCMVLPTIEWATSLWDGEQVSNRDFGAGDFRDFLSLDTFRCEFVGRPWGVATEFLAYGGAPNQRRALALTLLHDVPVRLDNDPTLAGRLWRAMDAFGRKQAEWAPYWSVDGMVNVTPANAVKVSLYRRAGKGALLVVSNLGGKTCQASLAPNTDALGLGSSEFSARDALSNAAIPAPDGRIHLTLPSMSWRLIALKPRR